MTPYKTLAPQQFFYWNRFLLRKIDDFNAFGVTDKGFGIQALTPETLVWY